MELHITYFIVHDLVYSALDRVGPAYSHYRRCQPRGRHASSSLWTGTLTIIITHDLVFSALDRVGPSYSPLQEMSAERKARILLLVDRDFDYYHNSWSRIFSPRSCWSCIQPSTGDVSREEGTHPPPCGQTLLHWWTCRVDTRGGWKDLPPGTVCKTRAGWVELQRWLIYCYSEKAIVSSNGMFKESYTQWAISSGSLLFDTG